MLILEKRAKYEINGNKEFSQKKSKILNFY
jgi:hypothetical protein